MLRPGTASDVFEIQDELAQNRRGENPSQEVLGVQPGARPKVAVESPTITHELSVGKLDAWLSTNGRTPREQSMKVTLRQMLGRMP